MTPTAPALVMISRDRRHEVLGTLPRLVPLLESGEASEILLVDNASTDGTAEAVRQEFPQVRLLVQERNLGAVGRNRGVEATQAPVVAFVDDDSWWEPGALTRAAELFDAHPELGLLHGRICVEPEGCVDEACLRLAAGPRESMLPGPSIITHLGCGVIVRREAFLDVGGYSPILGFGGEEPLLSLDLAARDWQQCYVEDLVTHHAPSPNREDWSRRWARYRRNDTLTALLRLPAEHALRETWRLVGEAAGDPVVRPELAALVRRLPTVLRQRRPVPDRVWHQWREHHDAA